LVVGLSAPGNLHKLLAAIKSRRFFLPGKGESRKSMVLARDVASLLVTTSSVTGTYNLTDQEDPTYAEFCNAITAHLRTANVRKIPLPVVWLASWFCEYMHVLFKIRMPYSRKIHNQLTTTLTFSSKKASKQGWQPNSAIKNCPTWVD